MSIYTTKHPFCGENCKRICCFLETKLGFRGSSICDFVNSARFKVHIKLCGVHISISSKLINSGTERCMCVCLDSVWGCFYQAIHYWEAEWVNLSAHILHDKTKEMGTWQKWAKHQNHHWLVTLLELKKTESIVTFSVHFSIFLCPAQNLILCNSSILVQKIIVFVLF